MAEAYGDRLESDCCETRAKMVNNLEGKYITKSTVLRPSTLQAGLMSTISKKLISEVSTAHSENISPSTSADINQQHDYTKDKVFKFSTDMLKKNCPNVATNTPICEDSKYVFGQNIHERVIGEHKVSDFDDILKSSVTETGMLFCSAINRTDEHENTLLAKETDSRSLTEAARVYEESRAQKRKYDTVETFTGEESEINVIELNCKLFTFVNGNWEERSRGCLRLNDAEDGSYSRVVFRTSGNLRLLLNTKIWSEMVIQRASPKSVRFTAMDNMNHVGIFLAMARPDDIALIYDAFLERINACTRIDKRNKNLEIKPAYDFQEPIVKKPTLSSK